MVKGKVPDGLRGLCTSFNIALVLTAITLIFMPTQTEGLVYDRQTILSGELWRLWTGHLVHYGLRHALIDVAVLGLVMVLSWRQSGVVFTGFMLLIGMPLLSLGLLLFVPSLHEYRGASGIDILLAVALGARVWRQRSAMRPQLLVLAVLLILKIMVEGSGMSIGVSDLPAGIRVVWEAHLIGMVLGVFLGWFWRSR